MTDDTENPTYALARMVVIVIRDNALLDKFITYNCIIICKMCPSKMKLASSWYVYTLIWKYHWVKVNNFHQKFICNQLKMCQTKQDRNTFSTGTLVKFNKFHRQTFHQVVSLIDFIKHIFSIWNIYQDINVCALKKTERVDTYTMKESSGPKITKV